MRTQQLLIALLIALVTIGGMLYFSMGALTAGQIAILCISPLSWLALFLYSEPQPQSTIQTNRLHTSPSASDNRLQSSIAALLATVETELKVQVNATEAELKQVKSIMDSAIDDLIDSFISLEASTRIEQKLVMLLTTNENVNDKDELNPFRDKQLKSKKLLLETSNKLNDLIQDAKHNEIACKSLNQIESDAEKAIKKIELLLCKVASSADKELINEIRNNASTMHTAVTKASKIVTQLHASSKALTKESKDVSHKVGAIIEESADNIGMVAEEMTTTAKQIEADVQSAIKSLQFQDTTSQLIVQCGERLKIMQEMLNTVSMIKSETAVEDSTYVLHTKLMLASDKLKLAGDVRMKEFNVDAGSVELFH